MSHQILDKKHWDNKRALLSQSYNLNGDWTEIIGRFEERVNCYFLNRIKDITILGDLEGEGFSILTLQCVLIEMFAAFKEGKIYWRGQNPEPQIYYTSASFCFTQFLQNEAEFRNSFAPHKTVTTLNFYEDVRCGLVHEARTKGDWKINAKKDERYDFSIDTDFITESAGKISIDRKILNQQLDIYFKRYLHELRQDDAQGTQLRKYLGRCLDHHYNWVRDTTFNWWNP